MKATWLVIGLLTSASAADTRQSSQPPNVQNAAEAELRKLNGEAAGMQVRKDVKAADRLLADDYVFLQADGNVSNKAQNLAVLRDAAFVCEVFATEDVIVRVYGDVGVITGRAIMRATYAGQDVGGEFLYTDVWTKRAGRWQTVVSQATRRPSR